MPPVPSHKEEAMRKAMAKRCAIAALPLALLPAFAAAAPPQAAGAATAHTQHVVLHRLTFQFLGKFVSAGTDRVVSRDTGRVAGFDTFRARERPGGMVFQMAFAFKGGSFWPVSTPLALLRRPLQAV